MDKVFKSKIDASVVIRRVLIFALVFVILVYFNDLGKNSFFRISLIVLIFIMGLLIPLRTNYKLTVNDKLVVASGFRKININIENIKSISYKKAWYDKIFLPPHVNSLDMLIISYNNDAQIKISPKEKEAFIKALQIVNPAISVV